MFPIALDITKLPLLLIGKGEALAKREKQLREAGAAHLYCHASEGWHPDLTLKEWLGVDASLRWHDSTIIMVTGLDHDASQSIATAARAAKKLVNVEDVNELCDFYFTANVSRGDLLIAVSTGGASPTLAKRVRDKIAAIIGPEWAELTQEIKEQRLRLRAEGKSVSEVAKASDEYLVQKNWLKEDAA